MYLFNYNKKSLVFNNIVLMTNIISDDTVGVVIPIQGRSNDFIIGYGKKISLLSWDGISDVYSLHHKFEVDKNINGNRFNDGKADYKGQRLWIGNQ